MPRREEPVMGPWLSVAAELESAHCWGCRGCQQCISRAMLRDSTHARCNAAQGGTQPDLEAQWLVFILTYFH